MKTSEDENGVSVLRVSTDDAMIVILGILCPFEMFSSLFYFSLGYCTYRNFSILLFHAFTNLYNCCWTLILIRCTCRWSFYGYKVLNFYTFFVISLTFLYFWFHLNGVADVSSCCCLYHVYARLWAAFLDTSYISILLQC